MYRAILLSSTLAWLGCATTAAAAGFVPALTWNDCPADGGLTNVVLPCAEGGEARLVGTFFADQLWDPGGAPLRILFTVDIVTSEPALPAFWDFSSSACPPRMDAWSSGPSCATSPWSGGSVLTWSYIPPSFDRPNRFEIQFDAVGISGGDVIHRGVQYFLFAMDLRLDSAVEAGGSCVGCGAPVTIGLLIQYPGGNQPSYFACATANGGPVTCTATPARNTTWGVLKSLYR